MNKCAICGKTHNLFTLDIPVEDEPNESERKHICGSCWDVISAVAVKAVEARSAAVALKADLKEAK